ncbi:D-alanyl-lipoteichoic acid biosynthesis protein DltD [Streptococcus porcinus]|uniref:D-alanyl-lipoteichoic acid biosynthesis protein DltD n=1 Tax=Streptococcus porcinus TaxID=1340 RepID=UPI001961E163|nr:D-alanyl-lipoteichoic acid biosynthesis protein DltD [Streptococcus porcinus]
MLKKLAYILGPLVVALMLVLVTIFAFPSRLPHSLIAEKRSAVAITNNSFKNSLVKRQALDDPKHRFVPFFGSSEWSRMDSMHPSIIAEKYQRSYRPYLLGNRGSQSLVHYYGMQQMTNNLKNKKAVFVISPQWFTPQGTDSGAVQTYLSKTQIYEFLLHANQEDTTSRFAAKRMLEMNPDVAKAKLLKKISLGQQLSFWDKYTLRLQYNISLREESLFSFLAKSKTFDTRIMPRVEGLPKKFSYSRLTELAIKRGEAATNNNSFGIKNSFYSKRIAPDLAKYRSFQRNYVYINSPEYNDFQLVLTELAKQNTDVLFIIPPVNQLWAKYTGLSQDKYLDAVHKIKYQLNSQGFNQIADFSNKGGEPYFMEDTIHMGWNGWLAVDKVVQPFLEVEKNTNHYKMNPYFYSREWAKKPFVANKEDKNTKLTNTP